MSSIVHTQPGAHAFAVQKSRNEILLAYGIQKSSIGESGENL